MHPLFATTEAVSQGADVSLDPGWVAARIASLGNVLLETAGGCALLARR